MLAVDVGAIALSLAAIAQMAEGAVTKVDEFTPRRCLGDADPNAALARYGGNEG